MCVWCGVLVVLAVGGMQWGRTALIKGAVNNRPEAVRLLLEHPTINVNIQNNVSIT